MLMRTVKHFYLPGLFSLLGLSLIVLFTYPEAPVYYTVLRHNLPSSSANGEYRFTEESVYCATVGKQILCYKLDTAQKDIILNEMTALNSLHDTTSVLQVNLTNENTYGDFVWVINETIKAGYKRYAFTDSSFYLFPNPVPLQMPD